MDADKDAICELMERGLWNYDGEDYSGNYDRAEALWGKWCDPERVECPRCDGRGWKHEDWYSDDDFGWYEDPCDTCYGTGKVRPPDPPPPQPPPSPCRVENAGRVDGFFRVVVVKDGKLLFLTYSPDSYEAAREKAEAWIARQAVLSANAGTQPTCSPGATT